MLTGSRNRRVASGQLKQRLCAVRWDHAVGNQADETRSLPKSEVTTLQFATSESLISIGLLARPTGKDYLMSKKQQRVFWPALIILSIVASAFVFANTRSRRAT